VQVWCTACSYSAAQCNISVVYRLLFS